MRTLRRLSALALLLAAAACDESPTAPGDSQMTARLNDRAWNGDAAVVFARDTVFVRTKAPMPRGGTAAFSNETGSWRELVLAVVASGPGTYQVLPEKSRYEEIIGGDVVGYGASVTAGKVRFTTLSREGVVAQGTVDDVVIEGSRGTWTFDRGGFRAPAVSRP
jgi:hypothetical protein